MTRGTFLQFACGQGISFTMQTNVTTTKGQKRILPCLLIAHSWQGRQCLSWIQIHCTMWCLQSLARTSWFSHGHAKRHRVHAARRWMRFLQGCNSVRLFRFKFVGIWKVYCTETAMKFEPNSICRNRTPNRHPCMPTSNFCTHTVTKSVKWKFALSDPCCIGSSRWFISSLSTKKCAGIPNGCSSEIGSKQKSENKREHVFFASPPQNLPIRTVSTTVFSDRAIDDRSHQCLVLGHRNLSVPNLWHIVSPKNCMIEENVGNHCEQSATQFYGKEISHLPSKKIESRWVFRFLNNHRITNVSNFKRFTTSRQDKHTPQKQTKKNWKWTTKINTTLLRNCYH